jgi:hypothetical protein
MLRSVGRIDVVDFSTGHAEILRGSSVPLGPQTLPRTKSGSAAQPTANTNLISGFSREFIYTTAAKDV